MNTLPVLSLGSSPQINMDAAEVPIEGGEDNPARNEWPGYPQVDGQRCLDWITRNPAFTLDRVEIAVDDDDFSTRLRVDRFVGTGSDIINVCGLRPREWQALHAVLAGTVAPVAGSYKLANREPCRLDLLLRRSFMLRFLGSAPNRGALLPHLDAQSNVALPLIFNGVPQDVAMGLAGDELQQFDMRQIGGRLPHQLPADQQRLVTVARALVHRPILMLLGLPSAVMGGEEIAILKQRLSRAAQFGKTCILMGAADSRLSAITNSAIAFRAAGPLGPKIGSVI